MNTPSTIHFEAVPYATQTIVDNASFDAAKLEIEGTTFFLLPRKTGALGLSLIPTSVQLAWPLLHRLLPMSITEATIIDFDAAFGGGPISKFVVEVFTTDAISSDFGQVMELVTGWPPSKGSHRSPYRRSLCPVSPPMPRYRIMDKYIQRGYSKLDRQRRSFLS